MSSRRAQADTFTLDLSSHNFHWNVTGPGSYNQFIDQFIELSSMLRAILES